MEELAAIVMPAKGKLWSVRRAIAARNVVRNKVNNGF
jgi:hypothetical protein